jgi:hypothetical protein
MGRQSQQKGKKLVKRQKCSETKIKVKFAIFINFLQSKEITTNPFFQLLLIGAAATNYQFFNIQQKSWFAAMKRRWKNWFVVISFGGGRR